MIKKGILFCLVCIITACAIRPAPITIEERYAQAQADVRALFEPQQFLPRYLNYYEALARGLKYNLNYRIKQVNIALQAGQLEVAKFTMFPALNVSGSVYTRNNDLSSFGVTSTGAPTDVLNSTPRTLRTARVGLSWNVLDFGLGYVRSKEQGQRILIAQEEARKQEQTLAQDILTAYWDAYNAQQLIHETKEFQLILNQAKRRLDLAIRDKLIPQENILNFQSALLEGNRRLIQLNYKYNKAMLDLKHLLNLPPDQTFILEKPPVGLTRIHNLSLLDFEKLDAITLVKRPELRGQEYQRRIAELGVKTAVLQALPGITFNAGWNYNSNKFLINNKWVDRSVDVAWNLLNLASLPSTYCAAKLQVQYESLKRMALTIAVLTQTRYAYWHYKSLSQEYAIARKQLATANAIYTLNKNRRLASLASDQQVIVAKLRAITSKMDEEIILSDMSTALGELYLSTGSDLLPLDVENQSIPELTHLIQVNFALDRVHDFNSYIEKTYHELFIRPKTVVVVNERACLVPTPVRQAPVVIQKPRRYFISYQERKAKAEAENNAYLAYKRAQAEQKHLAMISAQKQKAEAENKVYLVQKQVEAEQKRLAMVAIKNQKEEKLANQIFPKENLSQKETSIKNHPVQTINLVKAQQQKTLFKPHHQELIETPHQKIAMELPHKKLLKSEKHQLKIATANITKETKKPKPKLLEDAQKALTNNKKHTLDTKLQNKVLKLTNTNTKKLVKAQLAMNSKKTFVEHPNKQSSDVNRDIFLNNRRQAIVDEQIRTWAASHTNVKNSNSALKVVDTNQKKESITLRGANNLLQTEKHALSRRLFTIQLFGSYDLQRVKKFHATYKLKSVYYGETKLNGRDWFVLTVGKFDTLHAAKIKMHTLSLVLNNKPAWVRNMSDLKLLPSK